VGPRLLFRQQTYRELVGCAKNAGKSLFSCWDVAKADLYGYRGRRLPESPGFVHPQTKEQTEKKERESGGPTVDGTSTEPERWKGDKWAQSAAGRSWRSTDVPVRSLNTSALSFSTESLTSQVLKA